MSLSPAIRFPKAGQVLQIIPWIELVSVDFFTYIYWLNKKETITIFPLLRMGGNSREGQIQMLPEINKVLTKFPFA